jgi:tRNA threonylcarbamoyladenosine biosynthesis protein TsaB
MTLLAIDTATQFISLALHDGRQILAEQTWFSENHHSVELAPAVHVLLAQAHLTPADLSALAVSLGPGSYTGLRIGVALAKGMAFARNLPLVGVSTLDIMALAQPPTPGALILVLPAGRGRVVSARYHWRKGLWKQRGETQNVDWESLLASIDAPVTLSGEIRPEALEAIAAVELITLSPAALRLRRAGFLAEEAWTRLRASEDGSEFVAAAVAPIYVKTKDAPL